MSSAKCQTGIPEQAFISHLAPGIWHFLLAALVALTVLFTTAQAIGEPASFAAKGSPQVDGQAGGQPAGAAKIRFTVSGPTDVEVAIVNAKGDVVRHLAAGVLGGGGKGSQPAKNPPPEPLKPGLAQELTWDGKDDFGLPCKAAPAEAGRAAGAGPSNYTARVRLGMGGQLERMIPTAPAGAAVSFPTAIGVGPNGDVYVLSNRYMQAGVSIFVLNRAGKYLRTILPSPANLKGDQVKGLDRIKLADGAEAPIIYNGYTADTAPHVSGLRPQQLVVTPQGWIIFASGGSDMWDQSVPRRVLVIRPDGSTPPEVGFVGARLGGGLAYSLGLRPQQLAISADGKTIYYAGMGRESAGKNPAKGIHTIGKLTWNNAEDPAPFIGKPDEPGNDADHLNDPVGVATDAAGRIVVADAGNGRVAVFGPDGKPLGQTKVDHPRRICVHPGTGTMYVQSGPDLAKGARSGKFAIVKFDKAVDGKEVARLEQTGADPVIALDSSAEPARLWLANGGALSPIDDRGEKLELGASVIPAAESGFASPLYIALDAARQRLYVSDFRRKVLLVDLKTDQISPFLAASEAAVDRDGNVYVLSGYGTNALLRFTPDGKPLDFPGAGGNKLTITYQAGLPHVGVKGLAVAPNGDILAYQDNNMSAPMHAWVFGPDGKLKKENVIKDIPFDSACGLAENHAGNIYAGINLHDPKSLYPEALGNAVPSLVWYTPYGEKFSWYNRPMHKLPDGPPWNRPYINFYLYQYGSVFKFGPDGGACFSGGAGGTAGIVKAGGDAARPDGVPADAREYRNAYLSAAVWLKGAVWEYRGFGICANRTEGWGDPGCSCISSRFGMDEYDRLFVPDVFRCSIGVVDTAGNEITRLGSYGNVDSAGPKSPLPEPPIPLCSPTAVAAGDGKVYVADRKTRRVAVVKLIWAAEESCQIK